jgi:hypothetical protein
MLMYYTQQDVREPLDGENRKLIDGITTFWIDSVRISRDNKGNYILLAQTEVGKVDGRVYIPFRQMEYLILGYHSSLTNNWPVWEVLSKIWKWFSWMFSTFLEYQREKYYNDWFEYTLQNFQKFSSINTDSVILDKLDEISGFMYSISIEFLANWDIKIWNTKFSALEVQRIVWFKDTQTWLTR